MVKKLSWSMSLLTRVSGAKVTRIPASVDSSRGAATSRTIFLSCRYFLRRIAFFRLVSQDPPMFAAFSFLQGLRAASWVAQIAQLQLTL